MRKSAFFVFALILLTSACANVSGTHDERQPTYYNNGSYDDNGAAPPPNNGNQNFGRRW